MDVSKEVRVVHKRELLSFLDNDVGRMYLVDINTMINHKRHRLIVNISDLHSFRDLAPRILRSPGENMQAFSDAVKEGESVLMGFEGPSVHDALLPESFSLSLMVQRAVLKEL